MKFTFAEHKLLILLGAISKRIKPFSSALISYQVPPHLAAFTILLLKLSLSSLNLLFCLSFLTFKNFKLSVRFLHIYYSNLRKIECQEIILKILTFIKNYYFSLLYLCFYYCNPITFFFSLI